MLSHFSWPLQHIGQELFDWLTEHQTYTLCRNVGTNYQDTKHNSQKTDDITLEAVHQMTTKVFSSETAVGKMKMSAWRQDSAVKQVRSCCPLVCHAACSGNSIPTFPDNLSVPYSRVKKRKFLAPWKWEREVVRKRRYVITTIRCVTHQRTAGSHKRVCQHVTCFSRAQRALVKYLWFNRRHFRYLELYSHQWQH